MSALLCLLLPLQIVAHLGPHTVAEIVASMGPELVDDLVREMGPQYTGGCVFGGFLGGAGGRAASVEQMGCLGEKAAKWSKCVVGLLLPSSRHSQVIQCRAARHA